MASTQNSAAAAAPSNVVRLPTAPRRQVQQRWNRWTREAARELRQQWPGEYIAPHVRKMLPLAARVAEMRLTPELRLALTIFDALDERAQAKVRIQTKLNALKGSAESEIADAALECCGMSIGDQHSLAAALKQLTGDPALITYSLPRGEG